MKNIQHSLCKKLVNLKFSPIFSNNFDRNRKKNYCAVYMNSDRYIALHFGFVIYCTYNARVTILVLISGVSHLPRPPDPLLTYRHITYTSSLISALLHIKTDHSFINHCYSSRIALAPLGRCVQTPDSYRFLSLFTEL